MNIDRKISSQSSKKENNETMKPLLDIQTLDFYCRYVISSNQNIRVSGLNLVKDLFSRVDPSLYNDPERVARIEFINRGLDARLVKKLTDKSLIIQYINGGILDKPILDTDHMQEISDETLAYLNEQAAELSKSYFVDDKYDQILSLATNLKNANYTRRSEVVKKIQSLTSDLNMQFNKMDDAVNSSPMFTLLPGEFENSVSDTYARETSPSRTLRTGLTGLNDMMDGGFQAGRVYLLLAQAAGGKSFTMLDIAMQLKKYNKDYKTHDPTKVPTIVFLTMENSEDENVSRMLSMMTSGKTFSDYSIEESFDVFRGNGMNYDPENDPIDIVMIYKANLSVNTDYLYTLVDKLRETGREPICMFQDHIKRIRPVNKHNDMRLDLGEIINEFKAFANATGIPVITDSHLNRDASRTLDTSTGDNKKDLIRSLGSFNVSESFLMIDNCDLGIIINKETDSNGNLYMGFKCIKTRTKCDLEIFFQPYIKDNPIKLIEDFEEAIPSFRRSMLPEPEAGLPVQSKYSRFGPIGNNDRFDDDSEDFFGPNNMSGATVSDDILLPDNANQSSFIISGKPSEPVYNNIPQASTFGMPSYQPSVWEQELDQLRNGVGMEMAVYFMDENNICVKDALDVF